MMKKHAVESLNTDFMIVGRAFKTQETKADDPSLLKKVLKKIKTMPLLSVLILSLIIIGCILAPHLATHDPNGFYLHNLSQAPDSEFYFGTDMMGRDLYSMMWYGGRTSLSIGILGAFIIAIIGITYGSISGISDDKLDSLMMRITEMCGAIPGLLFVLILSAVFDAKDVLRLSMVIGLTGWFGLARIVRSEVRQIRNNEYVLYARCTGANLWYVMGQHLFPNFVSAIMFSILSTISSSITTETTLSFLGLGLPVDVISWGSMLSLANRALITRSWWVIVFPGLFLIVTLMCITNVGSYFRKEVNRGPSKL